MSEEIYKKCVEDYEISNFGNCRRLLKNGEYRQVKGSILNRGGGYRYFQTNRNNTKKNYLFHRLVATEFIGDIPIDCEVDHIDRNSQNNRVDNLRIVSHTINMRNTNRYITEISVTDETRHSLVCKKYAEENVEKIKETKKKYYELNKEVILQTQREKEKKPIECSKCKNIRNISYSQYNNMKRSEHGIDGNICRPCSAVMNLEKVGKGNNI